MIPQNVTVVAVTKTFPFSMVQKAYADGFRHVGENRVEEAVEKVVKAQEAGMKDIIWHMIGHVQSRKVRDVVKLFDRVDSVDSIEIAGKLNKEAKNLKKILHILLEVNLSGEKTKYGFSELHPELFAGFTNLVIDGLMTMAPFVTNAEDNRPVFQSMKRLSSSIRAQFPWFGQDLSMGTSCDYEVAIEEGATEVRLGEALFGPRR